MKRAILGENIHEHNCKVKYFIPNDERFFQIESRSNSTGNVKYLIHSVHDISDLSNIFTPNGIRLKGKSSQRDFYGLPLIWFGIYNEKDKQPKSRYGSFSFKIKIDEVLAKGSKYFGLGTRQYKLERSHAILITDREEIKAKTKTKKPSGLSNLEIDFPKIENIQENDLIMVFK